MLIQARAKAKVGLGGPTTSRRGTLFAYEARASQAVITRDGDTLNIN